MGPQCPAHLKACSALKPEFFAGTPLREFGAPLPLGEGGVRAWRWNATHLPFLSGDFSFPVTAMPSPLTLSQREREFFNNLVSLSIVHSPGLAVPNFLLRGLLSTFDAAATRKPFRIAGRCFLHVAAFVFGDFGERSFGQD